MADNTKEIVTRAKVHMYMNMAAYDSPTWERMAKGWSQLTENPNAQTESTQYICDESETTDTTSYTPSYAFIADLMVSEPTVKKIYDICQDRMTYGDCLIDCVKVRAFETPDEGGCVTAYREQLSVAVSNIDGNKKMTMSGNLNGQGDGIKGKFNIKTKVFTPNSVEETQ